MQTTATDKRYLCEAARTGDAKALLEGILMGMDPAGPDPDGNYPLHAAVDAGKRQMVVLLLCARAHVNSRDARNMSALMLAAKNGDTEIASLLINAGADPLARDKEGNSPLHYATSGRHPAMVNLLLRKGGERSQRNRAGAGALHIAARLGEPTLIALLATPDVVNISDERGFTPLALAVQSRNPEAVKTLLKHGADAQTADLTEMRQNKADPYSQVASGLSMG